MFVLASPLSSSLDSAGLTQTSASLTAPSLSVPPRTAATTTAPQPASHVPASTTADSISVSTVADVMPASTSCDRVPAWHAGFLQLLPAIEKHARIAFRRLKREAREEGVAEVVANAMVAYVRLIEIGKAEVAFATPLANYAIAQFYDGRRVGSTLNIRDITSPYCQVRKGVAIERLDEWDREEGCWQEVLVEDKTCTPAELAASRIDFAAWLATLSSRDRKIAKLLASGCGTSEVAEKVGLTWSRISQMRRELKASWEEFHEPKGDEPGEGALSVAA